MDVDLKYLKTFYTICTEKGFTKASRVLHLTQPAISYHIKMLEEQFKVRLIERVGKNIVINEYGRTLFNFCRIFFNELEQIRSDFLLKESEPKRLIKICSVSGFGRYVLFPLLTQLKSKNIRFDLRFRESQEIFDMVLEGECDLGITAETKTSNFLTFDEVFKEKFILVCSSKFKTKNIDWKALKTYENIPMISYEEGDYVFGKWFETHFKRQPKMISIASHFDELEEVVEMVKLGEGISIVPDICVKRELKKSSLKIIAPFPKTDVVNKLYAVTLSGAMQRPETGKIVDNLRLKYS